MSSSQRSAFLVVVALAIGGVLSACGGGGSGGADQGRATPPSNYGLRLLAGGNLLNMPPVNGTGSAATFDFLNAGAFDSGGNLYVLDEASLREVSSSGVVSTIAGDPVSAGYADATGSSARFSSPIALAVDASGNIVIVDTPLVRSVSPAGVVSTLVGNTSVPGMQSITGTLATLPGAQPSALVIDRAGDILLSNFDQILKITPTGMVTVWAGTPLDHIVDPTQEGSPTYITAMTIDTSDNVYVVQTTPTFPSSVGMTGPTTIWVQRISASGVVTNVAGAAVATGNPVGYRDGPAASAQFQQTIPAIAVDSGGNLYLVDQQNNAIRKIANNGIVSTVFGGNNSNIAAPLSFPNGPNWATALAVYANQLAVTSPTAVLVTSSLP